MHAILVCTLDSKFPELKVRQDAYLAVILKPHNTFKNPHYDHKIIHVIRIVEFSKTI